MKEKNPKKIEFICPFCKVTEKIPTNIVEWLDSNDQIDVDTDMPPRFDCEHCPGKMLPKYYIGVNGKVYKYEDYEGMLY